MLKRSLALGFLSLLSLSARAGGESSGGVDIPTFLDDMAWFQNENQSIKTCMVVSPQFGATQTEAQDAVNFAFKTWREYILKKEIHRDSKKNAIYASFAHRLALQNCDGTEDLKFYFGAEDDQVTAAKVHYSNPLAFSFRTALNPDTGWGKGFIWISSAASFGNGLPVWSYSGSTQNLKTILLHEVGHIFGVPHVPGTIMDPMTGAYLLGRQPSPKDLQRPNPTIDTEIELQDCFNCTKLYTHKYNPLSEGADSTEYYQKTITFPALLGRTAEEDLSVTFERKPRRESEAFKGTLTLKDAKGTFTFDLLTTGGVASVDYARYTFKNFKSNNDMDASGWVYYGNLTDAQGKKFPVFVTLNTNGMALRILLQVDGSSSKVLFDAYAPQLK
ncbi:MAG: matrixin family metalloprotease [Bdellovibrionales bacterium]|nr:matrixin family metalloprotease [Bdellovibrionales bacterium]